MQPECVEHFFLFFCARFISKIKTSAVAMVTRSLLHLAHGFRTSVDRNYFFKGLYWTLTCQPIRNVYNPSVRRHKIKVVTHTHFFFTLILIFACFSPSSVLLFTRLLPLNKIMVMKAGKVAFQMSRFVSVPPLASLDIPTVSLVPRIHNETHRPQAFPLQLGSSHVLCINILNISYCHLSGMMEAESLKFLNTD